MEVKVRAEDVQAHRENRGVWKELVEGVTQLEVGQRMEWVTVRGPEEMGRRASWREVLAEIKEGWILCNFPFLFTEGSFVLRVLHRVKILWDSCRMQMQSFSPY